MTGSFWRLVAWLRLPGRFPGTQEYWRSRYERGGHSGAGSRGRLARFKADFVNDFVAAHGVASVLELGCGDGNQLELARYPRYLGVDLSEAAIERCRRMFAADPTKSFLTLHEYASQRADLALSLDVIYHLVEDAVFERYMHTLLDAATHYVIIYSSDTDDNRGFEKTHIRHRAFTRWIAHHRPDWVLLSRVANRYPAGRLGRGSFADFHVFGKIPRDMERPA